MPDAELAERRGCSNSAVASRRWHLGIAAFTSATSRAMRTGSVRLSASAVREHRVSAGLSQSAAAELAGLSLGSWGRLEAGSGSSVRTPTAERVAQALGCTVGDLSDFAKVDPESPLERQP